MPAGRPERSVQWMVSCLLKRQPEESVPHSFLSKNNTSLFGALNPVYAEKRGTKSERFTFTDLDQTHNNDKAQGHKFSHCENILDPGSHTDTTAVHPGQQY